MPMKRRMAVLSAKGLRLFDMAVHTLREIFFILILLMVPLAVPVQALMNTASGSLGSSALDTTSASVILVLASNSVTSAVSEISPNSMLINSTGNACTYDILPTITASDTGINEFSLTAPAGHSNLSVTGVTTHGLARSPGGSCPGVVNPGEYCVNITGQVMTVSLGTPVVLADADKRITITIQSNAPGSPSSGDFTATVDDTTSAAPPQSTIAGNADGDNTDNNSITMQVISNINLANSTVTANPLIVMSDGVSVSTITVTLRDSNNQPVPGKVILISSDRGADDIITQPSSPTDAKGVAVGTISSGIAGISTVTATDTTDVFILPIKPKVYFTQGLVLELTKTANKKEALVGDVVTYLVELKNKTAKDVIKIKVDDQIPPNFKYLKGSTRLNGQEVADPAGNRTLLFDIGTIPALVDTNRNGRADPGENGYAALSYQLIIGSGATPRDYINIAAARDICDICLISNSDEAKVTVTLDPLFDLGTIIGKVFDDKNNDGWQDKDEPGVSGAMVVLDTGTYALTDDYGRYHFPMVRPGHHLVKINLQSLPFIAKSTMDEARVVSVTPGLLARANFGVTEWHETKTIGRPKELGIMMKTEENGPPVKVMGSAQMLTVLINGEETAMPKSNITMEVESIDEVVEVKGQGLEKPVAFHSRAENAGEVKDWNLLIMDAGGSVIRTIHEKGAPPEVIEWDGLTDQSRMITGGEIYQYQMEVRYENGTSNRSARRLFGVNQTSAISLNMAGGAFESGSDKLSSSAVEVLKETAALLLKFPEEKIFIEGHTDSVASAEYNLDLSMRRAIAAKTYLVEEGNVPEERFIVHWYGESSPVASNDIPEGRELNRRVEVKGEVKEVNRAKLHDQYRTRPMVTINGSNIDVDQYGRFMTSVDGDTANDLNVEVSDSQGRSIQGTVHIPWLEILQPSGKRILGYGEKGDGYRVYDQTHPGTEGQNSPVMEFELIGRTASGNVVELDNKQIPLRPDGTFTKDLPLRTGNNAYGFVVRNAEGFTRIVNLNITVSDRDDKGRYIVTVEPISNLSVNFPPQDVALKSDLVRISGTTDPGNQVQVNDHPVLVQPDGTFSVPLKLGPGRSLIEVRATDPEGYVGTVQREVETSNTKLFLLAFADGKIGQMKSQGYVEGAGTGESGGSFTEGRITYYLKGVIAGKYLITSAFDSGTGEFGDLFTDLDKTENDRLLTNIDPDKAYPVYGDSSTIVYDTDSQGKFYLAVDSEEFHLLVGNYALNLTDTELAAYKRTLYGATASYKSPSKSKYGKPDTEALLFGAEIHQEHVHDEIRATGGSLYYLSHKDVIEGSEQVTLAVRDKNTGSILARIPQQQNIDYTIKYEEGRILFNRPVSSVVQDDRLIDLNLLPGNPAFILVDYERQADSFEKTASGGRVRKQIGDHFSMGGTYIKDELTTGDYELRGIDSEVRLGKNTRVMGEYAESKGADAFTFRSDDGGLTYDEETPEGISEGKAWKLAAEMDVGEWFGKPDRYQAGGYIKKLDSGFLSNGNFLEKGTEKSGLNMKLQLTEKDKVLARYDIEKIEKTVSSEELQTDTGTVQLVHNQGWWSLAGELQTRASSDSADRQDLAAAKLSMHLSDTLTVHGEHQQTLSGEQNDQTTLGVQYNIHPALSLNASGTTGSEGESVQGGAVLSLGDRRIYLTERVSDDRAVQSTSTIVGADAPIDSTSRIYSEYQWERSEDNKSNISLVGMEKRWDAAKGLDVRIAGERSTINSGTGETSRNTIAASLSYAPISGVKASARNEVRRESGGVNRIQYLTSNIIELKLSPDYTVLGKYRYSLTLDRDLDRTEAKFDEKSIGLAYRPVAHDRMNAIAKYTHLSDQRPLSLGDMGSSVISMDVASMEWALDINKFIEWVEKGAYRIKAEETGDRPAITTHTYLIINRLNIRLWKPVDLGMEYRILAQKEADDSRQGWLSELMWEVVPNMRLGFGYNFTDFTDNEFSDNNYATQGWFMRVQGKY